MLGLQRKIFKSYEDVVNGEWRRDGFKGRELADPNSWYYRHWSVRSKVASYGNAF